MENIFMEVIYEKEQMVYFGCFDRPFAVDKFRIS